MSDFVMLSSSELAVKSRLHVRLVISTYLECVCLGMYCLDKNKYNNICQQAPQKSDL